MITVPDSYGFVVVTAAAIAFQCVLIGFAVMGPRGRVFSKEFFKANFPGVKVAKGGYPDMGSGQYAQKLSHADWVDFNNAQRAHYSYVEVVGPMIAVELLAGLFYPRAAVLLGVGYIVGRVLYWLGYTKSGPGGRALSLPLVDGCMVGLFGLAFYGGWTAAGGLPALIALVTGSA